MSESCPNCGKPLPQFACEELLELYQQLIVTDDIEEREDLMLVLADIFADHHDATDADLPREIHACVERYEAARLSYRHRALDLGRLAMQLIEHSGAAEELANGESAKDNGKSVN